VVFNGLELFDNNGGLITLVDGLEGDRLILSGDYHGRNGARLAVDAFLGGPGSTADILQINGNASGETGVVVNNTNPGPGEFNDQGIVVVEVFGTKSEDNFFLPGGPIDTGFFDYDLFLRGNQSVLLSAPNATAHQLPRLVTAAQDIWHQSAGVWFDRSTDLRNYFYGWGGPVAALPQNCRPAGIVSKSLLPECPPVAAPAQARLGPGIWAKAFGDWSEADGRTTVDTFGRSRSFDLGYEQATAGVQAGIDFPVLTSPSSAVVLGVMAGYVHSKVEFDHSPSQATFEGGNVGVYATYLDGNFFADALFKADFLDMRFSNAVLGRDTADVTNYGARLDMGYRFNVAPAWFVEPLATIEYVTTEMDGLRFGGNRVAFEDNDSTRGRLGLRLGTQWQLFGHRVESSIIGSLWHRFSDENAATLTSTGETFSFRDHSSTETYGEIGTMHNIFSLAGNASAFIKSDIRFGDDLLGTSLKAGVRIQW
jgi:autotransporter family porin